MAVVETFINDRGQYIFISKRVTDGVRIINPMMKYNIFIKPTTACSRRLNEGVKFQFGVIFLFLQTVTVEY